MNIFLRSLTVGLIPLAMWAVAALASDSNVLMEEMTTTEVGDAIKAGNTTALIFNGSTEAPGRTWSWESTTSEPAIWASASLASWATPW